MKFYELKKGQAFRFVDEPESLWFSAGVDGAYGRFVSDEDNVYDHRAWLFTRPLEEVSPA